MSVRSKLAWLTFAVSLGVGVWIALRHRGEPMLLDRAAILIPATEHVACPYLWLSDSTLLVEHDATYNGPDRADWFRWDTSRRRLANDPLLKAALRGAGIYGLQVSPAGDWLLSGVVTDGSLPARPRFYYVCRTDGTRALKQMAGHGFKTAVWLADGRHWIEIYASNGPDASWFTFGRPGFSGVHITRLRVFDVDAPGRVRSLDVPATSLLNAPPTPQYGGRTLLPITADRFLICDRSGTNPQRVTVREIDRTSPRPIRTHAIMLPEGRGAKQLLFTPRGDRILWRLAEWRRPGWFRELIHRFVPAYTPVGTARMSVWVSRIDGSAMREIGGVNNAVPEMRVAGGPMDLETGDMLWGPPVPRYLRWAPDGRRISFGYRGAIWTAPAD